MFNQDILLKLRRGSVVYITEGAIDCMTLVQHGLAAVSLGSAKHFRPEWAKLFNQFRVFVWFDNDEAGKIGTRELIEVLRFHGIDVEAKALPSGVKDINEYYNKS